MAKFTVDSTSALTSALKTAQAGDTIQLASGTYSGVAINNLHFGAGITITSADPAHKAVITNFNISSSDGLTFSNVEMFAKAPAYFAFQVRDSNNITFDKVHVHGTLDGNSSNDADGIQVLNSAKITVTNSEFQQLGRAMAVGQSKDIVVQGNNAHDLRSDGFDFAEVSNVKIVGNTFRNFNPIGDDHPDAIQFWTAGTKAASHDILISGNVIMRGEGGAAQGIFLKDEIGTLPYERVTISNNLVVGTGYSGVRVMGAKDLKVTGNELVSNPGEVNKTFLLIQNATTVSAVDNKAVSIGFEKVTGLTQSGNVVTTAVTDLGAAAVSRWLAANKMDGSLTSGISHSMDGATKDAGAVLATPLEVTITAGKAGSEVVGNSLDNVLNGNSGANNMSGMAGNDTLDGGGGADTLAGGAGNDYYVVPNSLVKLVEKAGEGIDTVNARGDFTLGDHFENLVINTSVNNGWAGVGNGLNNQITGNAGANRLDGMAGNDTINGGAGNDNIIGGGGDDRLTGGAGADVFRFAPGGGKDVITDAGAGDSLDVSAYIRAGMKGALTNVGADLLIKFSNGDSIMLLNHQAGDLSSSWAGWVL